MTLLQNRRELLSGNNYLYSISYVILLKYFFVWQDLDLYPF